MAWNLSDTTLCLIAGQGVNFPTPTNGQRFWLDIDGCDCCTRVEVTGRNGDVLTIVPPVDTSCACIKSNSRVSYARNAPEAIKDIASELGFDAVPPLHYDCATRRLWIDCEELKTMVNTPCNG
jgi:hypothetical protein